MPFRRNLSSRRHRATFSQHDGTQDTHGVPTYGTSGDWDAIVSDLPVEMVTVSGGERLRGRQVTEDTTHVLFSDYHYASTVTSDMRVVINSVIYQIVSVRDVDGDSRELRVELRRES